MPNHLSLSRFTARALTITSLILAFVLVPAFAAEMPLAAGSPLAGFSFDDQPLMLPVQQNFQMALLTSSTELGRSCGKMEAYGWRMKQSEQQRVDQIFNSTVDRLRALGYVVETQTPNSISRDVTLFIADRPDRHFMFMWSAGEIGLVMVLCQSSAPLVNNATTSYYGQLPQVHSFPKPGDVLTSELNTPVRDVGVTEANARFSPLGKWVGTYSCAQGFTGGTLDITSLNGKKFKGTFKFYATRRNPRLTPGSYAVFGEYDRITHRILINPGKWIKRPPGYADTIIVGGFDPATRSFSGFFQGVSGCTSFEAKQAGPSHDLPARKKHVKKKRQHARKSAPAQAAAPYAPLTPQPPAATSVGGPPSPGIPVGNQPTMAPAFVPPQPAQIPPPPTTAPAPQ